MTHMMRDRPHPLFVAPRVLLLTVAALAVSCGDAPDADDGALTADVPLHLEDHLDRARVVESAARAVAEPVTWSFADGGEGPAPEGSSGDAFSLPGGWRSVSYPGLGAAEATLTDDALRLDLGKSRATPDGGHVSAVAVPLPDWDRSEWGEVILEARSTNVEWVDVAFNLTPRVGPDGLQLPYQHRGKGTLFVRDGQTHAYRLRADWSEPSFGEWEGPWTDLVLEFWSSSPASVDIVSVKVVPKAAAFAETAGASVVLRGDTYRRVLYTHAPGLVEFPVRVPPAGRLDVGLGVVREEQPVTFRVTGGPEGAEPRVLLEETVDATGDFLPRSVDLRAFSGADIVLGLETRPGGAGAGGIGLWSAPVLSGTPPAERPNIIFYVIDGAGADYMSVYGHDRATTPNLERLAADGVVFERAHSNSAWTKPSTASFMTSLQQSALGGFHSLHDAIPDAVPTMAELFHGAGYQNAVFTSNPWAGSASNLQRGTDLFRDQPTTHHSTSSVNLQASFWEWRDRYPGGPYWVHFQTTDVHEPHEPVEPFAGLFVAPEERERFEEWWEQVAPWEANVAASVAMVKDPQNSLSDLYRRRLKAQGIDPREFFSIQEGLYEECMAHQDHQLGLLVEELKERGEWENTILVVASDHGHPAGSFSRFGREQLDPLPSREEGALLDSHRTRIPLIVIWPGHLKAGTRVEEPVSMIDVLPTLLELAGLAPLEVSQGQSLVPLLNGEPGWEPRPIILEQLQPAPEQGELVGHIEIIDGRWGASLEIWPESLEGQDVRPVGNQRAARPRVPGRPRLLLYDLESDPLATRNANAEHPELVEKYTKILERQWAAHQDLAKRFEAGDEVALTPEQLESLRSLGYIQ